MDILHNGQSLRTYAAQQSPFVYPQADQIADFGAGVSSLTVCIYQMSALVGRGFPASATFMNL
jgi:hypothetical protein